MTRPNIIRLIGFVLLLGAGLSFWLAIRGLLLRPPDVSDLPATEQIPAMMGAMTRRLFILLVPVTMFALGSILLTPGKKRRARSVRVESVRPRRPAPAIDRRPRALAAPARPDLERARSTGTAGGSLLAQERMARSRGRRRDARAYGRGFEGERAVGELLGALPAGWRVWHDLDIGGENIDHVVASAKGVFIVEVKNYRGTALATPNALYTHGNEEPNEQVIKQVWRQVFALNGLLGGEHVQPVLVFVNGVRGAEAGAGIPVCRKVPCLGPDELLPFLRERKNVLPYERGRTLFVTLDDITR